jgi:hypothetical protein
MATAEANVKRIHIEEVVDRATDERAFVHRVAMRATEAWREYLRWQGLPPYPPSPEARDVVCEIEIHLHVT